MKRQTARNLDEYAQLCTFIERAQAIIARASAEAAALTGESGDVLVPRNVGLSLRLEAALKLKADYELVLRALSEGISTLKEESSFLYALNNCFGQDNTHVWRYNRDDVSMIDEGLKKMGVKRQIRYDVAGFVKKHGPKPSSDGNDNATG